MPVAAGVYIPTLAIRASENETAWNSFLPSAKISMQTLFFLLAPWEFFCALVRARNGALGKGLTRIAPYFLDVDRDYFPTNPDKPGSGRMAKSS
jgi:hypothetical protein